MTSREEEKERRLCQLYAAVDGNAAELFPTDRLLVSSRPRYCEFIGEDHTMVLKHERKTPGHAVVFLLVMLASPAIFRHSNTDALRSLPR